MARPIQSDWSGALANNAAMLLVLATRTKISSNDFEQRFRMLAEDRSIS